MKPTSLILLICVISAQGFAGDLKVNTLKFKGTPEADGEFCVHNGEMFFTNWHSNKIYTMGSTSWEEMSASGSGIRSTTVYKIDAENGKFYFATDKGLCIKDGSDWSVENTANSKLNSDRVLYVRAADNIIVVITDEGLSYKFNGSSWVNIPGSRTKQKLFYGQRTNSLYELNSRIYWTVGLSNYFVVYDINKDSIMFPSGVYPQYGLGKAQNEMYGYAGESFYTPELAIVTDSVETLRSKGFCIYDRINGINPSPFDSKMFTDKDGVLWRYSQTFSGKIAMSRIEDGKYYPGLYHLPLQDVDKAVVGYDEVTHTMFCISEGFSFSLSDLRDLNNETPGDMAYLDINQISTPILNSGVQNRDLEFSSSVYKTRSECQSPLFSTSTWISGYDDQENLHLAAMTYGQAGKDFWPGPLDESDGTYISDTLGYDRVWKVNLNDIRKLRSTVQANGFVKKEETTEAIWNWPGNGVDRTALQLGPFHDENQDNNYDPEMGDYPLIKGDQCVYWIMNDNKTIHGESGGKAFGFEIQCMAYSYDCSDLQPSDSFYGLNYTTFYHYKIINRSNTDYKNVVIGSYIDVDLGNFEDDYVGCNVTLNTAFGYNADTVDKGNLGYGLNPPMISAIMLNAPVYKHDNVDGDGDGQIDEADEKRFMGGFATYDNDFTNYGNPVSPEDYNNYLRGRWKDSSCFRHGGPSGSCTQYLYPGISNPDHSSNWTQQDSTYRPRDQRMLMNTYSFDLKSKESVEYEYALVYSRDPEQFDQFPLNQSYINAIRDWYYGKGVPDCYHSLSAGKPEQEKGSLVIYPVPSKRGITIQCKEKILQVRIMDMTGRVVYLNDIDVAQTEVQALLSDLKADVYVVEVTTEKGTLTSKLVHCPD